jgi:hypothetical protein
LVDFGDGWQHTVEFDGWVDRWLLMNGLVPDGVAVNSTELRSALEFDLYIVAYYWAVCRPQSHLACDSSLPLCSR